MQKSATQSGHFPCRIGTMCLRLAKDYIMNSEWADCPMLAEAALM
jgi:hypothetical protein